MTSYPRKPMFISAKNCKKKKWSESNGERTQKKIIYKPSEIYQRARRADGAVIASYMHPCDLWEPVLGEIKLTQEAGCHRGSSQTGLSTFKLNVNLQDPAWDPCDRPDCEVGW